MSLRRWAPLVSLLVAAPASAQPAAGVGSLPSVAYDAPQECPSSADFDARLVDTLGAAAARTDLPPLSPSVSIRARETDYAAVVVIRDGEHETQRELSDPSCGLLVDAAALIIAVTLVPDLVPFEAAPEEPVLDPPEPAVDDPAVDDPAADDPAVDDPAADEPGDEIDIEAAPPAGPTLSGTLRLAAHATLGALPGVVLGGEVAGGIRWDALRVELAVRGLPLAAARFGVDPSLGADLALAVGLLRALAVASIDTHVELYGGGGIDVGVALGRGVGLSVPRDAAAPWVALEAALGAAWVPLRQVAIVLEVEVLIPVVRPVFVASGLGTLFRPEPVAGALRLGVEARFP